MFKPKPVKSVLLAIGFKLFTSLEAIARGAFKQLYSLKGIAVGTYKMPRILRGIALVILIGVSFASSYLLIGKPSTANATTSSYLNFQARLESSTGSIVPDGSYNVEFKIYNSSTVTGTPDQGACTYNGGTADTNCLWVETRTGANKVRVANGYLTVNLGSVNAFGSINWSQQLYLTMRIGGTGTPSWDTEMSPRITLTAVPYAFQSQSATQLQATVSSNVGTLSFDSTMTGGNQTFVLPDQGAAGSYHVLTQEKANAGYVQLQGSTPGTAQTGSFNIAGGGVGTGVGIANILQAGTFDTPAGTTTLNIGTTNATSINLNQNTTVASGKTLTVQGNTLVKTASVSAFQVQNASGLGILTADTLNGRVGVGINVPQNTFSVSPVDYQTGTVTRTNGSATLVGTGTTWTNTMPGDIIVFADGTTNFVASFTDATHVTMATTYAGITDPSPISYRFYKQGLDVAGNGLVGIGDVNPDAALSVRAANQNAVVNIYGASGGVNPDYGIIQVASAGSLSNAGNRPLALQPNNGDVLIATTTDLGAKLSVGGTALVKTTSTAALQVQNGSGSNLLTVDTSNGAIILGNDVTPSAITVRGGAVSGVSNTTGSNITFDASNGTGAGGSGDFIFRTAGGTGTITQDAVSNSGNAGSTSSFQWSHTVANQSGRILIVGVVTSNTNTVTSVKWDPTGANQSFTQLGTTQTCPVVLLGCHMSVWYVTSPATGTHNIQVNTSASANSSAGAVSYYNIDTTTPFGSVATNTGSSAGATSVVGTTSASQLAFAAIGADNTTTSAGTGQTQTWNDSFVWTTIGSSKAATGGSVTLNWNVNSGGWATIGAPLNPASNTTADTLQDRLHITAAGNVGINTSSPQYTLDVAGIGNFATSVYTPLLDVASAGTLSIGTTNATTVNIANNAAAHVINIGSTNGTSQLNLRAGTGNFTLDGANSTNYTIGQNTTTGQITIGGTAQTGSITLGSSNTTSTVLIGNGSGASTVSIANTGTAGNIVNIAGDATATTKTDTVNIATGNTAGTGAKVVHIADGTPAGTGTNTVTIGSLTNASTTTIQGGVNGTTATVSVQAAANGVIAIGTANANTVSIGAVGTTANASTINIGNTTGNATQTINIGAINSANNAVSIQGGTGSSAIALQTGTGGTIGIGTNNTANTIQIGSTALGSGTQTINIGNNNTSGGTTNVTIGAGSSATGGTTALQAKGNITLATNGTTVATFDTSSHLYLGNGISTGSPNNFTIQGTGSTTTAVAGGSITIQGGNATVGSANGGNLTLSGGAGVGTGVSGLVVLTTPTFQTASTQSCGANCTITQANVDGSSTVVINATASGLIVTLPAPTITGTYGRVVYVTAASGSSDFTLRVNGGGAGNDIAMRQNTTATMIWGPGTGTGAWTAAGASSSTTLQAAYDNTLTSAGGAELILSNTNNHNGLTIRDSLTAPVSGNGNGTLLEVQTAQAANLFSVNSNVTDYANNGGAESTFGTEWAGIGTGASVSRNTTAGFVANGTGSAAITTTGSNNANSGGMNVLTAALTANLHYNVSFAAILGSGSFTDLEVDYSKDGTNTSSAACTSAQKVPTSVWTKVNCTFTAPSSGITSSNAILIRQTAAANRTWYVDNLSVTIAADLNYATDGGVDNSGSFNTNWPTLNGATTTWDNTTGNDTSDSAKVQTTATTNQGIKNVLSINPQNSTLYRISVYASLNSGSFTDFSIGYSPDDGGVAGANFKACVDYNTQTVPTGSWQQITCYVTTGTTSVTAPRVYFYQSAGTSRTFWVDTFSMTLASNAVPNVQIGGGVYGGPTTLLTLDRAASAPIAANNDALLGSMYYDTTLGKLQCYESDGWGACGSSPDNIITISPEYTNAVLHGTGVGTMTSDICSNALHINDGTSSQPTICGTNETYNFYKWTSPQGTPQTYSIYVTYQLPSTFKSFSSGSTSIKGRTDSSNATVQYSIYRNNSGTGLTQCGTAVTVSTGSVSSWQLGTATGAADPSTCGFTAGDSIVFKIDMTASSNANAYVSNLGFTFSNR